MADAMPDYQFERMKLERQRKGIHLTMLDQRIQLEDLKTERASIAESRKDALAGVPSDPKEVLKGRDLLAHQLSKEKAELAVFDLDIRSAELDGNEARLKTNIAASAKAIAELDANIAQLKEVHGG